MDVVRPSQEHPKSKAGDMITMNHRMKVTRTLRKGILKIAHVQRKHRGRECARNVDYASKRATHGNTRGDMMNDCEQCM